MSKNITRRSFAKASAAAAALGLSAAPSVRAAGANDRVRLGLIGTANRGGQLLSAIMPHKDAEVVALCDVWKTALDAMAKRLDGRPALYGDFRRLIERKDLDAVVIATPDHWHAIQTIAACGAGKDVYVEKPLSMTIHEGRRMVEAARRTKRVVQVGTHRRSGRTFAEAAELVRSGRIGKVTVCRAYHRSNMTPSGIGREGPAAPPSDLDWEMWLGPRPLRPFQKNIAPYKFRWWDLYSSQTANNGVHYMDLIRWLTGDLAPSAVCSLGGKYAVDDDRTIPDTQEITFAFPAGRLVVFGLYETCGNQTMARGGLVELRGTKGTLFAGDNGYEAVPEHGGQFQNQAARMEPIKQAGRDGDLTTQHMRNFLDCIKSRAKPNADVEEGHRSTTMAHLANMSQAFGERLNWDAQREQVTNHPKANELLSYEYRKPWTLE
jgi:predicted dehydrogenase